MHFNGIALRRVDCLFFLQAAGARPKPPKLQKAASVAAEPKRTRAESGDAAKNGVSGIMGRVP